MTRKLREIEVEEISLVSKAATKKKFMIIKNAEVNIMDLKDFLVEFLEDEDVEEFQKAENEGKLKEKLQEALKEIRVFEADLPGSFRKAIGILAQWAFKGYGSQAPSSDKKKVKKQQISYWPSFDIDGKGKEAVEKINKEQQGDPFPSVTKQLFGSGEEDEGGDED